MPSPETPVSHVPEHPDDPHALSAEFVESPNLESVSLVPPTILEDEPALDLPPSFQPPSEAIETVQSSVSEDQTVPASEQELVADRIAKDAHQLATATQSPKPLGHAAPRLEPQALVPDLSLQQAVPVATPCRNRSDMESGVNIPALDDKSAEQPAPGVLRVSKEAIEARLRRLMAPRVNGGYLVSEAIVKKWKSKGKARESIEKIFQSVGFDKERVGEQQIVFPPNPFVCSNGFVQTEPPLWTLPGKGDAWTRGLQLIRICAQVEPCCLSHEFPRKHPLFSMGALGGQFH